MEMVGKPHVTPVEGTSIAWSEMGEGEPLVLLHGLGDSHRTWRKVAPLLATRFHVYMVDLPGHGLSGRPDAPYTLTWFADMIAAWMDAIGLARAHLVGHSFGGGIAQWMLLNHRPRIERLALVSAGGLGREVGGGLRFITTPFIGPLLAQPLMYLGTRAGLRVAAGLALRFEPGEIARLAWMNAAPGTGKAFRRTVAGVIDLFGQHVQTWHRIGEVPSLPPMALYWGDNDAIIPARHGYQAFERLRNTTLTVYARCGHFPQLEHPERVARDLDAFLQDATRTAPWLRPVSYRAPHTVVGAAVARVLHRALRTLRAASRRLDQIVPAPMLEGSRQSEAEG